MRRKIISTFFLIAIMGIAIGVYGYMQVMGPYVKERVSFNVPSASSYDDVLSILHDKNLVKNDWIFEKLATKMNFKNNVHGGFYSIKENTSLYELLKILRGGLQTPISFTLNNVNFKEDLAKKISKQLEIDSTTVIRFLNDETLIEKRGYTKDNIMTLFIPNTYELYWNITFETFLDKMQTEHDTFWNDNRTAKAKKFGLTPTEAYILASIVEKEYKHAEERKRIAGVYINRLNQNMLLQADPTVKYALGDLSIKRILTIHTEYDNPYNTYYYAGLPPGPICLPETSTIEDVLNAEEHNYTYFCAKSDLSGYHEFNTTYAAHLRAAKRYHAALNKLKIYE